MPRLCNIHLYSSHQILSMTPMQQKQLWTKCWINYQQQVLYPITTSCVQTVVLLSLSQRCHSSSHSLEEKGFISDPGMVKMSAMDLEEPLNGVLNAMWKQGVDRSVMRKSFISFVKTSWRKTTKRWASAFTRNGPLFTQKTLTGRRCLI